ncbi:MAG TPA: DUF2911 domain-containing protein [Thermoanaerobaculia bacterium]|nr:DUF2911 domain-containing protein [Thermoanaerobaculia bacterium]
MLSRKLSLAFALVSLVAGAAAAAAQDLHPSRRPSPMGMARITLDDTYVRVVYSRPYERGRENIFGGEESGALVPFGKVWRTGANEATEITVTGDVLVAGQPLASGTYSLFTTPGAEQWQVHFNSALGLSGAGYFADGEFTPIDLDATNALTVTAAAKALPEEEKVEQLTLSFDRTGERSADMVLRWITTELRVPISLAGD